MKLLIVAIALVMSASAFAQKHMVQVGTDNTTIGNLSWESSKTRGSNSTEDKSAYIFANYAMTLTDHIQAGVKANYSKFKFGGSGNGSSEQYGIQVGGVYNLNSDLKNALYASLYLGWDWGRQTYQNQGTEVFNTSVAIGKRFPLSFISENVTYSPEIAYVSKDHTKSEGQFGTQWSQAIEFRIVQFSIFF